MSPSGCTLIQRSSASSASLVRVVDVNRAAIRLVVPAGRVDWSDLSWTPCLMRPLGASSSKLVHVADGDPSFQWEGSASTVKGEPLYISTQWMVPSGSQGDQRRVLIAMIDVTDRVEAETSLRNSEARMRALFAAMNDIIVILDQDGKSVEALTTGASQQYPPARLIGRSAQEVFSPVAAEALLARSQQALAEHVTTETAFSHDIDGSRHWFEVRISPLPDGRVLLIAHDATARHDAQEAARTEASSRELLQHLRVSMEVTDMDLRLVP